MRRLAGFGALVTVAAVPDAATFQVQCGRASVAAGGGNASDR
jgi:hypothetical protein